MNNIIKLLFPFFLVTFFLCDVVLFLSNPSVTAQQEGDEDIQKKPDYWCPKIVFVGKTAEIFTLRQCEYISGITIKVVYHGRHPYPHNLKFTLLDSTGKVIVGDKKKRVFGPRYLEKGEYGIFTIQNYGSKDPFLIEIEGVWD